MKAAFYKPNKYSTKIKRTTYLTLTEKETESVDWKEVAQEPQEGCSLIFLKISNLKFKRNEKI